MNSNIELNSESLTLRGESKHLVKFAFAMLSSITRIKQAVALSIPLPISVSLVQMQSRRIDFSLCSHSL